MKILMLVNWKIKYSDTVPEGVQPPDYYVPGLKYWFFRYFENQDITVDVVDIGRPGVFEKFERDKLRFYIRQTLRCIGKLGKYDVVLSHGMQSGIVLCLLRRLFGKGKYKHIVFDIGAFNSAREEGRALKFMQFAGKSLDGVIYHTKNQKEYYEKCHPWLVDKSAYIPFGTDAEFFATDSDKVDICEEKYVLCVGSDKRDWDTLTKAYLNTNQKYKLRLIGNSSVETNSENIEVLGRVYIEELKNQMCGAAFCVLPLKYMNYSFGQMTLLQQMALGKAVIVADVPSVEEYVDEKHLVSYEPENAEDLKEKLQKLMDDSELCKELGNNAKEAVRSFFNEEIMAKRIEKAIYEFVKEA